MNPQPISLRGLTEVELNNLKAQVNIEIESLDVQLRAVDIKGAVAKDRLNKQIVTQNANITNIEQAILDLSIPPQPPQE